MGYNRPPRRIEISGIWIEYILIAILAVLVLAIIISLLGPYISNQVTQFLIDLAARTAK